MTFTIFQIAIFICFNLYALMLCYELSKDLKAAKKSIILYEKQEIRQKLENEYQDIKIGELEEKIDKLEEN